MFARVLSVGSSVAQDGEVQSLGATAFAAVRAHRHSHRRLLLSRVNSACILPGKMFLCITFPHLHRTLPTTVDSSASTSKPPLNDPIAVRPPLTYSLLPTHPEACHDAWLSLEG